ncbi:MAG: amidohydrolase [Romboutsia sp.]
MKGIDYLVSKIYNHRFNLNKIAEIGQKEYKTAQYIRLYLDTLGIEYKSYLETDTVGIIKGNNPKKTIAFRSDIDGLKTLSGVEHLCGHDGHMSILLGLIEFLNNNKVDLNDNIVFIFQPAEEGPGGAKDLIDAGLISDYKIDEIYGLHIYPEIEQGYVGIREGYFMAQSGEFDIEIKSKSAHGAMPQNGIDAIIIASNIINSLQTIISRNISPTENGVVTVGKIIGGSIRNIIAENVVLQGVMRTFDPNTYNTMKERMRTICKGYEEVYNCNISVDIIDSYPAVNNNNELFKEFITAIDQDKVINLEPLMISEDFSYYQKEVAGLFFMLGSKNQNRGFINGLHNSNFNFDEEVLMDALEIYLDLLKHKGSLI